MRTEFGLKIWDIRNYKAPIAAIFDLPCYHPYSKFAVSPDEKYMLVPTSVSKSPGEEYSYIKAYKTEDLSLVHNLRYSDSSITDIMWHAKLN